MPSPSKMALTIAHRSGIPTCWFISAVKVLVWLFFFFLINIANQHRKNLPDLICQNTYGYRVKSVFHHSILDAKSVPGET